MAKKILFILIIFVIGAAGGIFGREFLLPLISDFWPLNKIDWSSYNIDGTTIINKSENITIVEDEGFARVINQISPKTVLVEAVGAKDIILTQGTGIIVTADGLILTDSNLLSSRAAGYKVNINGEELSAKFERMSKNGLALLRVEKSGLPVVSFADKDSLVLGEKMILVGLEKNSEGQVLKFINKTFVRKISGNMVVIDNIFDESSANGAPLVNIEGKVIGTARVAGDGEVEVASFETIREFLGF